MTTMFPVPNHLPRSNGDPITLTGSNAVGKEEDSVLDLVEPLFKAGNAGLSVEGIRGVREQLQQAISSNKVGFVRSDVQRCYDRED